MQHIHPNFLAPNITHHMESITPINHQIIEHLKLKVTIVL
jgi:hypothetical protein